MRAEELIQRIKLEGDADITAAFERISEAGTRAFSNLQQSVGQTPETFEKSSEGAEELGNKVQNLDTKFKGLIPTLTRLGGALGVAFGIRELVRVGEAFDNINDRIRSVTDSVDEQEHVYQRLLDVSNNTRTSLEENTKSFQTFAVAMRNYGRSTDDAIIAQENLIRTVKLSGLDMSEASGIVSQLTRALAGGSTESYRFTQQLMRVPRLAQLIAESVGKSRDEILKMAEAGEISADVILNALTDQGVAAQELRDDFENLRVTVGEAVTVIGNNLVNSIGRLENSIGAVEAFAASMILLSEHIEAVGAAMLVVFGPAMYRRVVALFALIRAHPFVAIATIIAAIVGYLHSITDGFQDWTGAVERLRSVLQPFIEWLARRLEQVRALAESVRAAFAGIGGRAQGGPAFAAGGPVWGAGTATSDSIPAYLSSGEYVIRAAAVRRYGQRLFDLLNNMRVSPDMLNFNMGGLVSLRHLEATGGNNGPSSTLNLTIGGEVFENLIAPRETARRLERFATRKQLSSAGRKPGWYS